MPTRDEEPADVPPSRPQGELPPGLSRVQGWSNVTTSRHKPCRERSVIPDPELIELHSSGEEDDPQTGGSPTTRCEEGQGSRARHPHHQRMDKIFQEAGRPELLQAYWRAYTPGETGEVSQVQGTSPRSESRPPLRKPHTVPEVLKGTVHNKPMDESVMVSTTEEPIEPEISSPLRKPRTIPLVLKGTIYDKPVEEPMMVSTGQEQLEPESRAVSPSQETVVVSTSTTPDTITTPQGLVLSNIESATMPIITITGDHVPIPPSEPEGSLVREMAAMTTGTPTRQDSLAPGEESNTQEEQDPTEVIDIDGDSDEEDPEVNLNQRAALERSARDRGIRNRRSYGRRRLYQAVVQLHRLSERSIRSWTRNRGRAIADSEVESPIGPTQVQRVHRPVRHPNEVATPGKRHVPSSKKGSSPNK